MESSQNQTLNQKIQLLPSKYAFVEIKIPRTSNPIHFVMREFGMALPIQESKSLRQFFSRGIGLYTSFTGFTDPSFLVGPWGKGWRLGGYRVAKESDDEYIDEPRQAKPEEDAEMVEAGEDELCYSAYDDYLLADVDME